MEIKFIEAKQKKQKPTSTPKFGTCFTDYMFVMEYREGKWQDARIQPYGPFSLDPSTSVFHYGQEVFEGLKAFKNKDGEIRIFRPWENFKRMNESCARVCIPQIDEKFVLGALEKLVDLEKDWIPTGEGTALYIRPAVIATDPALGVHAAHNYIFFIILCPVGAYYAHGLEPVKLFVEKDYVRACKGGTGHHKVGGNYAASILSGERAAQMGYDQVMWLDGKERKYVEEVGSMNIFFCLDGKVVTPELGGSILPGITRKSVIELLRSHGKTVEERIISIDEIVEKTKNGALTEIFGTGTAAVISPVGHFMYDGKEYEVGDGKMGEVAMQVYSELTGIQNGRLADKFGWVDIINK